MRMSRADEERASGVSMKRSFIFRTGEKLPVLLLELSCLPDAYAQLRD
jgi:hypothetical protein